MIPVKICGITNLTDAQLAAQGGASAIGLIFYKNSPRYVSMEVAKEIIASIDGQIPVVGVFVDENIDWVLEIAAKAKLDIIQLHGKESPQYCEQLNVPIIKVLRVDSLFDKSILKDYNVSAFLFDTYKKGLPGGTGDHFDWGLISDLKLDTPIILSGGLNIENIMLGIATVNPSAVDVNSGVENCPGEKDEKKMTQLFNIMCKTMGKNSFFQKLKNEKINV